MSESENFGSFIKENKKLLKEYLEARVELYKLKFVRLFSKLAGYLIWMIICLLLLWLLIVFIALVTGFWLSGITGSYTLGFGITTLVIGVLIIVIVLLMKKLLMNPIIRTIIKHTMEETEKEYE